MSDPYLCAGRDKAVLPAYVKAVVGCAGRFSGNETMTLAGAVTLALDMALR